MKEDYRGTISVEGHRNNYRSGVTKSAVSIRRAHVCRLQRRLMVVAGGVFILICGILLGSGLLSSARSNASHRENLYKYYTSIEVSSGDTLWTIAERYADSERVDRTGYIQEIKEINHLQDDTIHAGDYLTISYYSNEFK